MSFATETKNELSRVVNEKKCCMLAEISGFLRVAGSMGLVGLGKFKIKITTENPAVVRHYKRLLEEYFQIVTELEVGALPGAKKGHTYIINIGPEMRSEQILRETGFLLIREGNNYFTDGIYGDLIRSKCCRKAYLRGLFMGAGTMSNPQKGYHFEIVTPRKVLAADLKKMMNTMEHISAKVVQRKDRYVVYIKSAAMICDLLKQMGAPMQEKVYRSIMENRQTFNETTRLINCDNANTDRTLDASQHQLENIKKIQESRGLDSLPEKLRVVAELRLEYPEASLLQLAEMLDPPMKKSGINNRFRKIEEIASKL